MFCLQRTSHQGLDGEPVSNHDELMSNFFAQPDALALGKTAEELKAHCADALAAPVESSTYLYWGICAFQSQLLESCMR